MITAFKKLQENNWTAGFIMGLGFGMITATLIYPISNKGITSIVALTFLGVGYMLSREEWK